MTEERKPDMASSMAKQSNYQLKHKQKLVQNKR